MQQVGMRPALPYSPVELNSVMLTVASVLAISPTRFEATALGLPRYPERPGTPAAQDRLLAGPN